MFIENNNVERISSNFYCTVNQMGLLAAVALAWNLLDNFFHSSL